MCSTDSKIVQQIYDELLVCKICLDSFRNPKCLSCLHTFCAECIENHVDSESTYKKYSDYRDFTCPLCRKRTQLPAGGVRKLTDNFLLSSLSDIVVKRKSSDAFPLCEICKNGTNIEREAVSKCLDCVKLLCDPCVRSHRKTKVTSGHAIYDIDTEKDIACKEHQDEPIRFYCLTCSICVCVICAFNKHRDHEITQFAEAAATQKHAIQLMIKNCRTKINVFDSQMKVLTKCEEIIRENEAEIHDRALSLIQEVRECEKRLIEQLRDIYGYECMKTVDNKDELEMQTDNLKRTCALTNTILNGKDIELLLVKKDIHDKLSLLVEYNPGTLPATAKKIVEFRSGSLELGALHEDTTGEPALASTRNLCRSTSIQVSETGSSELISESGVVYVEEKSAQTSNDLKPNEEISSATSESETSSNSDNSDSEETSSSEGEEDVDDEEESGDTSGPDGPGHAGSEEDFFEVGSDE